jgi:hypothetical protein
MARYVVGNMIVGVSRWGIWVRSPDARNAVTVLTLSAVGFALVYVAEGPLPMDWLRACFELCLVGSFMCAGACVMTDPGVLPPMLPPNVPASAVALQQLDAAVEQVEGDMSAASVVVSAKQTHNPLLQRDEASRGGAMLPYCRTCRHIRPVGCSHCSGCNVCVMGFDHHCFVLGCCVGQRTMRFFAAYLVAITAATNIALFGYVVPGLMHEHRVVQAFTRRGALLTLLAFIGVVCGTATLCFTLYYVMLLATGSTSKAYLNRSKVSSAADAVPPSLSSTVSAQPRTEDASGPCAELRFRAHRVACPPASVLPQYHEYRQMGCKFVAANEIV